MVILQGLLRHRLCSSTGCLQQRRLLTLTSARKLLRLSIHHDEAITPKALRLAYFEAAKSCHPDSDADCENKEHLVQQFLKVTDAYEFLQGYTVGGAGGGAADLGITEQQERVYRQACQDWLGLDAEIVEESKKCPMFRQWLTGKDKAAQTWSDFFQIHGGLAPMLRPRAALLEDYSIKTNSSTRRKRK